jgi:hypothetical protein
MNGTACANATPTANSGRGAAAIIGSVAPAGGSGVVAISIARDFVPQSLTIKISSLISYSSDWRIKINCS